MNGLRGEERKIRTFERDMAAEEKDIIFVPSDHRCYLTATENRTYYKS